MLAVAAAIAVIRNNTVADPAEDWKPVPPT
jgi:hypothetical protein